MYILSTCHAQAEPIYSLRQKAVSDLAKGVSALFAPSARPDVREYQLIGLTKSELSDFVRRIPYDGVAQSDFGGQPTLSGDGSQLITFRDPDHGPEYFELTYQDDRVDTVQHHVGGFVGDRLPGFVEAFRAQEGPLLSSKQAALDYTLREKDWQIHCDYYKNEPAAIAHFYLVAGKVRMETGQWQKAQDDFLLAKKQLASKTRIAPLPSP